MSQTIIAPLLKPALGHLRLKARVFLCGGGTPLSAIRPPIKESRKPDFSRTREHGLMPFHLTAGRLSLIPRQCHQEYSCSDHDGREHQSIGDRLLQGIVSEQQGQNGLEVEEARSP